jgi:hypothetical protein
MMKGHCQMGTVTETLALEEMQKLRPLDRAQIQENYLAIVDLAPIKSGGGAASARCRLTARRSAA